MIGRKLGNRYEVIERIGGGGMAVVYRALDTLLNRSVSIKVLRAQFSTDEDFVRRFRREAQAAASLSHPNVVNIYDVGVEGEDYYIVMEYVDGMTLKEVIQDRAPLPVGEAIDIAKQICAALGHAHENNIVHRDIKPHNILIGRDGRVKVTDFGIARAITSNTITQDGSVLGSVHYFSPEQARGGITDVKSDIYSLGVVLYEMVTGELPFSGETPISVALKHLQDHFVEPRQINSSLPQSVENIVLKSLAKDPTVRYQTTREMYRDLEKSLLYPNVPKFMVPLFDEQQTIQMPAVGLRNNSVAAEAAPPVRDNEEVESELPKKAEKDKRGTKEQQKPGGKKKRRFWRPVLWLLGIFMLLIVAAGIAYYVVANYMGVKDVTMPNVVGEKYDQAVQDLTKAGLDPSNIHKQTQTDNTKSPNTVLAQDQYAGKVIKANREVTLTVAVGPEKFNMPNVVTMSKSDALAALNSAGIPSANITTQDKEDSSVSPGTVLSQSPDANSSVDNTVQVKLTIAKAVSTVTVPNLAGKSVADAQAALQALGLTVGQTISQASDTVPQGQVIHSTPDVNSSIRAGESVDLYVSSGLSQDSSNQPKKETTAVTVDVPQGQSKVQVRIMKTDALGSNQVVVAGDEITQKKTYNVDCIVEPNTMAYIQVYMDGTLKQTIPVSYDNGGSGGGSSTGTSP